MWTIAWPPYMWSSPATAGIASSGTARMISSTSSTSGVGVGERPDAGDERPEPVAPAGVAARDRVDRPAGPVEGDAEGRPDRALPRRSR